MQHASTNAIPTFQVAMRLLTSILAILFATMPLTAYMGKAGFTLWLWAIFFTFSGTFVLMPTATEKAFGAEHYSANYGLLFTTQVIFDNLVLMSAKYRFSPHLYHSNGLIFSPQTVSGPLIAMGNQALLTAFGFTGCFLVVAVIICLSKLFFLNL